jgi:hypothetical protein
MSRFMRTICDLRSMNWESHIGWRELRQYISEDRAYGVEWTITPWTRNHGGSVNRSDLLHNPDGAIYAVFIRRKSSWLAPA